MRRYLQATFVAFLLLAGINVPAGSQDAPSLRSVELHLMGLSRGYLRPLDATSRRMVAKNGIDTVKSLGHTPGMTRLLVTTRLDDDALALLLQMRRVGDGGTTGQGRQILTLAPKGSSDVRRAEARRVISTIYMAIQKAHAGNVGKPKSLFKAGSNLAKKLKVLALNAGELTGEFYRARDFHIEEESSAGGWFGQASYRIWAGAAEYEGLPASSEDWGYTPPAPDFQRDPTSPFVGAELTIGRWNGGFLWTDHEGLGLNDRKHSRNAMTDDGTELVVQSGAAKLEKKLRALAGYRLRNPQQSFNDLPRESGRSLNRLLDLEEDSWRSATYGSQTIWHTWIEDDPSQDVLVRIRAYDDRHPLYLDALIDIDDLIRKGSARIKKSAESGDEKPDKKKKSGTVILPEDAVKWTVGAEKSTDVFRKRRLFARAAFKEIFKALQAAVKKHTLGDLCGSLTDQLAEKIGVKLASGEFKTGDFSIRQQMFGDVEISVGSVVTGGRWWMLANPGTGKIIRSHQ